MEELKDNKIKKLLMIVIAVLGVIAISLGMWKVANNHYNNDSKKEETAAKEKTQITPLMYEITKEGSNNKIYLFGSMHIVNLDEFDFPKYLMDAYNNSDIVAPEFDIIAAEEDIKLMTEYTESLMYSDDTTLKDHLSEETYNGLIELFKSKNQYIEYYEMFKPELWESLLSNMMAEDAGLHGDGADHYFLQLAKKDNKQIIDVESFEFQASFLNDLDEKIYDILIGEMVSNYDEGVEELKELYQIWKDGNASEIERLALEGITEEDRQKYSEYEINLIEEYNNRMLRERNIGMKNKLEEFFNEDKKVFFMVGAAHLVGEDGIANLLILDGYTVKQVNK